MSSDPDSVQPPLKALVDEPDRISDDELLYRVVQSDFVKERSPTSQAFQDYPVERARENGLDGPCASVAIDSVWRAAGADPERLIDQFGRDVGVVSFVAGEARRLVTRGGEDAPQGFMTDPKDEHPWHAVMFDLRGTQRSQAAKKAMLLISKWVYPPGYFS